jgi:uncharacterized membrane protein YeaQ/YmgE (transglycosylase-associated protein family)
MDLTGLLVQVVAGALGGSAAGAAAKQYSLGTLGNAIAGAIGASPASWSEQSWARLLKARSATSLEARWVARSS